jgi:hypothetical protein
MLNHPKCTDQHRQGMHCHDNSSGLYRRLTYVRCPVMLFVEQLKVQLHCMGCYHQWCALPGILADLRLVTHHVTRQRSHLTFTAAAAAAAATATTWC